MNIEKRVCLGLRGYESKMVNNCWIRTCDSSATTCCYYFVAIKKDLFFSFKLSAFEVNFMDDVGQTLLNWASAFGTQEMVS